MVSSTVSATLPTTFPKRRPSRTESPAGVPRHTLRPKASRLLPTGEDAMRTDEPIRVHRDSQFPARFGALAATVGRDVHFARGVYRPHTPGGRRLLAHEFAHVRQQAEGRVRATRHAQGMGVNESPALEAEADRADAQDAFATTSTLSFAPPPAETGSSPAALVAQFVKGKLKAAAAAKRLVTVGAMDWEIINPQDVADLADGEQVEVKLEQSKARVTRIAAPPTPAASGATVTGNNPTSAAPTPASAPGLDSKESTGTGSLPAMALASAVTARKFLIVDGVGGVAVGPCTLSTARHVIVQAAYMSGDRFGISAALQLDPNLGVMILATTGGQKPETDAANELATFYRRGLEDPGRIGMCETGDSNGLYKLLTNEQGIDAFCKLSGCQSELFSATAGTRIVAENFKQDAAAAQERIVEGWLDPLSLESHTYAQEIQKWLIFEAAMFPAPSERYALLWVKTGDMAAEKSHHFTSPGALAQLIEEIPKRTGRIPVLVGDDLGLRTQPYLGAFWNDPKFQTAAGGGDRVAQLRLFHVLATEYDCVSIGTRSGGLEGPALVGLRTIYLEEQGNLQPGRMEQWLAPTLPHFMRVILDRPPGKAQQDALATQLERIRKTQAGDSKDPGAVAMGKELDAQIARLRTKPSDVLSDNELAHLIYLLDPRTDWSRVNRAGRYALKNPSPADIAKAAGGK